MPKTLISSGLNFLVCDSRNQNQQTEMIKKGKAITERRKWAFPGQAVASPFFQKGPRLTFSAIYFHGKFPNYVKLTKETV